MRNLGNFFSFLPQLLRNLRNLLNFRNQRTSYSKIMHAPTIFDFDVFIHQSAAFTEGPLL